MGIYHPSFHLLENRCGKKLGEKLKKKSEQMIDESAHSFFIVSWKS